MAHIFKYSEKILRPISAKMKYHNELEDKTIKWRISETSNNYVNTGARRNPVVLDVFAIRVTSETRKTEYEYREYAYNAYYDIHNRVYKVTL
jgi:hypothetical protein